MATIYLVRHGEDTGHGTLTVDGNRQSHAAAQAMIRDCAVTPWSDNPHVLSSPRPRTQITAGIIANAVGAQSHAVHVTLADGDLVFIEEACILAQTLINLRNETPYILVTHEPTVVACLTDVCGERIDHAQHGCVYRITRSPAPGRRITAKRLVPSGRR